MNEYKDWLYILAPYLKPIISGMVSLSVYLIIKKINNKKGSTNNTTVQS